MIWKEVEEKYGKKIVDKTRQSKYLRGITVELTNEGKVDIPEYDIKIAYKDVTGKYISPFEWD